MILRGHVNEGFKEQLPEFINTEHEIVEHNVARIYILKILNVQVQYVYTPGFRSRPVLGQLRLLEFFIRSRLQPRLLVKENMILEFLKTEYKVS